MKVNEESVFLKSTKKNKKNKKRLVLIAYFKVDVSADHLPFLRSSSLIILNIALENFSIFN